MRGSSAVASGCRYRCEHAVLPAQYGSGQAVVVAVPLVAGRPSGEGQPLQAGADGRGEPWCLAG